MALADYIDRIKAWNDLPEDKRNFFIGDNYLSLSELHAERIKVLRDIAAVEFKNELLYKVPAYSIAATADFQVEEIIQLQDVWNDEAKIQATRKWLHEKKIPYATQVFLIYHELIVVTEWKILVKYWDAFAYNVGLEMVAVDRTKSWTCTFHHEDVITFRRYK